MQISISIVAQYDYLMMIRMLQEIVNPYMYDFSVGFQILILRTDSCKV